VSVAPAAPTGTRKMGPVRMARSAKRRRRGWPRRISVAALPSLVRLQPSVVSLRRWVDSLTLGGEAGDLAPAGPQIRDLGVVGRGIDPQTSRFSALRWGVWVSLSVLSDPLALWCAPRNPLNASAGSGNSSRSTCSQCSDSRWNFSA
jgi:hypothetical protein